MCPEPERKSSHCSTNPSSEEQDRMGREETVHIRINRRRRRIQMWHQWFGLGSLSPLSGAGTGLRIRLGLDFRMDTWSRSMGTFLPGKDPEDPCPRNPIKPETL